MRILSVSTLFPAPGRAGFGRFVAHQMDGFAQTPGADLVMVNPIGLPIWPLSRRAPYAALASCPATSPRAGYTVHHPRFRLWPLVGGTGNPARIARAVLPLARRLHAEQPFDLVDAQFFFPDGPAAMLVAQALGLPFTIKARGSDIHYWSTRPAALAQMRAAAGQAAALLAVSAALKADMVALGMPEARIHVHYTGLDHARFFPRPQASARADVLAALGLALPAAAPLLLCPGALIAIKGQRLAIAALASVPRAHLLLAGSGSDEPALRALAEGPATAGRVHFLGQVAPDLMAQAMSAADVVVLPSEREGLANVWIEALASGAPLVIPPIGGAAEVVTTPAAGRLAARDPAAIASAINALLAAPPMREETAAAAARFSWQANAGALAAIWQQAAPA